MKLAQQVELNRLMPRQFSVSEDFLWYISPHMWTTTVSSTGAIAVAGHGGIATLTPAGAANDYAYLASTNAVVQLAANTTVRVGARLNFTQASVNNAMVHFGIADAVGATTITDSTGLPKASFSGAVIYTKSGSLNWNCRSSVGSTNTDTATTVAAGGGASGYQLLEIEFKVVALTQVQVNYFVSTNYPAQAAVPVLDPAAGYGRPLQHTIDATSFAAAQIFVGTKNGNANAQALLCDFINFDGIRA